MRFGRRRFAGWWSGRVQMRAQIARSAALAAFGLLVASPVAAAQVTGEEVEQARTRTSSTFVAGGGALRTRMYAGSVNYRTGSGVWEPISNRLVGRSSGGWRNEANGYVLELPSALGQAPVVVRQGSSWLSFALDGASGGSGRVAGNAATFPDVLPGVDVLYEAESDQVKETLMLASASAGSSFRFDVRASEGLRPRAAGAGLEWVDGEGRAQMAFGAPFMVDAVGRRSLAVRYDVAAAGAGWAVTMVADRDWLADPTRRFPVKLDPSTFTNLAGNPQYRGADSECYIQSGLAADTKLCGIGSTLDVGFDGTKASRALVKFGYLHNQIRYDSIVLDARFGLYADSASTTLSAPLDVHRLTRGFYGPTWNMADAAANVAWTTAGGDFASTASASKSAAGETGWHWWTVRDLVQDWGDRTSQNFGVVVKQQSELVSSMMRFRNSGGTDGTLKPALEITYLPRTGALRQYTTYTQQLTDRSSLAVNVANGNLMLSSQDVSVPGTGLDLGVGRSFNSIGFGYFSFGLWEMTTGADVGLMEVSDGSIAFFGAGKSVSFFRKSGSSYVTPTGLDATLTKAADGTWTLRYLKTLETLSFNTSGKLTRQQDRNGNAITFAYRADGYLQSITDTQDRVFSFTHTGTSKLIVQTITDPTGRTWTYGYDANGDLVQYTDPDGAITKYTYQTNSGGDRDVKTIEDSLGGLTEFTYPAGCTESRAPCRVKTIKRYTDRATGAGDTTTFDYYEGQSGACTGTNDRGRTVITDARGHQTTYCWDKELRVTKVLDPEGHERSPKYSPNSDVVSYTVGSGAAGAESTASYDSSNRLESLTRPASDSNQPAVSALHYTGRGSSFAPSSGDDAQGNSLDFTYTTSENLKTVHARRTTTAPDPAATPAVALEYNDGETGDQGNNGTVRWSKDGNGNRTDYSYDTKGNLLRVDPPAGSGLGATVYTYDTLSRPKTITDGRGFKRQYTYDPIDRVRRIEFFDTSGTLVRTDTYVFDKNGNRTERNDTVGTTLDEYDAKNRLKKTTLPGARVTTYSYDANDNLASITHAGEQILYGYDPDNLVTSVTEPGTKVTTFAYNTAHSRTRTTYPNGVEQTIGYDRAERPKTIRAVKGTTILTDFSYDYTRVAGSSTKEQELRSVARDLRRGTTTTYGYDALARLDSASTTGAVTDTWTYIYDGASNRLRKTRNGTSTSYAYNPGNQLCWSAPGAISTPSCTSTPAGATTYSYDAAGNQTGNSTGQSLAYNAASQTTSITPAGGTANTFTYHGDTQDERATKNNISYQNTALGLSSETCGSQTDHYVRDNRGKLVTVRCATGSYYYLQDALGSITALTDAAGTVTRRHVYNDPYGEDVTSTGTTPSVYRFAGEYLDQETGLYKIGARYYDPTLGRWTQRDPVSQPTDPRQTNAYTYAGADPVNLSDPAGRHFSVEELGGAVLDLALGYATCAAGSAMATAVGTPVAGVAYLAGCATVTVMGAWSVGNDMADEDGYWDPLD